MIKDDGCEVVIITLPIKSLSYQLSTFKPLMDTYRYCIGSVEKVSATIKKEFLCV